MFFSRARLALYGARQITQVLRPTYQYTTQFPAEPINLLRMYATSNAEKLAEKGEKPLGLLSGMLKKEEGSLCAYKENQCPPFKLPDPPLPNTPDVSTVVEVSPADYLPPRQEVPFPAILAYRLILFAAKVGIVILFIRWTMKEGLWGSGDESSAAWTRLSGNLHVLSADHSEPKSFAERWNQFVYYTFDKIVQVSSNVMTKLRGPRQDQDRLEYFKQRLLQATEDIKDSPENYGTSPSSAITILVTESQSGEYETFKASQTDKATDKMSETKVSEIVEAKNKISGWKMPEIEGVVDEISGSKMSEIREVVCKKSGVEKVETTEINGKNSAANTTENKGTMNKFSATSETAKFNDKGSTADTTETKDEPTVGVKMSEILKCAASTEPSPVQKYDLHASSGLPELTSQLPEYYLREMERSRTSCPFADELEQSSKVNVTPQASQ